MSEEKLIEGGWESFFEATFPNGCPEEQKRLMRDVFFAGAQHMFCTTIAVSNKMNDINFESVLDSIAQEMTDFIQNYELKNLPTEGRA